MNISSRTPEGKKHTCANCGHQFRISPSVAGDACCPICNTLVWPNGRDESDADERREKKKRTRRAKKKKEASRTKKKTRRKKKGE